MKFLKPNLEFSKDFYTGEVTPDEREFAEQFTAISPVACSSEPDAHSTWLLLGNRQFRLDWNGETEQEASLRCLFLARGHIEFEAQRKAVK